MNGVVLFPVDRNTIYCFSTLAKTILDLVLSLWVRVVDINRVMTFSIGLFNLLFFFTFYPFNLFSFCLSGTNVYSTRVYVLCDFWGGFVLIICLSHFNILRCCSIFLIIVKIYDYRFINFSFVIRYIKCYRWFFFFGTTSKLVPPFSTDVTFDIL